MKSLIVIASSVALIALSGAALADSVRGKIVAIDNFNRVSLDSGQVFKLGNGLKSSSFRKNDVVEVTWFTFAKSYPDAMEIKLIQRR